MCWRAELQYYLIKLSVCNPMTNTCTAGIIFYTCSLKCVLGDLERIFMTPLLIENKILQMIKS